MYIGATVSAATRTIALLVHLYKKLVFLNCVRALNISPGDPRQVSVFPESGHTANPADFPAGFPAGEIVTFSRAQGESTDD